MNETIYALSSAPGRAGVAVIRISGSMAKACLSRLSGSTPVKPRVAALRTLRDGAGAHIDQGLVLWFPAPASFTGEDMVEFQVHGGRAVLAKILGALAAVPSSRPAEPGEFTRRAVENGKLDLTQAEAVIDLIDAETEVQRDQALRQYGGSLSAVYDDWRLRLVKALAWAEAEIDFSDEDLPGALIERARADVSEISKEIQRHVSDARRGEIIRDGLLLTVIGPPNAGKSSLVNALARRDVAIVSETAGTTRDIIEVRLDLNGYAVIVADTAGLRQVAEAVESEGVRRALARAEASDLTLLLLDGSAADPLAGVPAGVAERATLTVWNKADLLCASKRDGLRLSLKTGEGVDRLLAVIGAKVAERLDGPSEAPMLTRARHRHAAEQAKAALDRAVVTKQPELFAEDLRLATRWIGRITGRVDVEELLDVVFRDFCIGK